MKVEISHDILAKKVYDRIGAEDKMRLKIVQFIRDRFAYFQENSQLLSKNDLNYISPYLDKITVTPEQTAFLAQSRREVSRKENRRRLIILSVVVVMAVLTAFALIQGAQAKTSATKAQQALEQVLKEQAAKEAEQLKRLRSEAGIFMKAEEYWFALSKWEEARQIDSTSADIGRQIQICREKLKQ